MVKLVCISDTHYTPYEQAIPDGDVLIHAGDHTGLGTFKEVVKAGAALAALPHKYKLVIPGNHDFLFEKDPTTARMAIGDGLNGVQVLIDQMAVIEDKIFWGSPWSSFYMNWAFGAKPLYHSALVYGKIPEGCDVVISHGPPEGIRDWVRHGSGNGFKYAPGYLGNKWLKERIEVVKPKVHVFGHIHDAHGQEERDGVLYVNAAMCDEQYAQVNAPIVVDI